MDASIQNAATQHDGSRRWWTLLAVCGSTFMLLVDISIVQVALPTIQRHLHASFPDLQWTIDAYALTLASLILTFGSAADRFGRRQIFVVGLSIFTLASLLCAVATNPTFLIWSRAVQGIGGAAMFATGLALIGQEFRGPERGHAIAVWGATVGGAVAVGPLVGGVLTSGLGWQWIFFVNIPVGVATIWIALTKMANIGDPGAVRLDILGLLTFSTATFLLVFALIRTNEDGWSSPTIVSLLVASAVMWVCFVLAEHHQRRPMFDLSLFRRPSFTAVSIATFATGAGMFAMFPFLTLYLQNDLGYSPLQGGLRLLPSSLLCFFVPLLLRSVVEKIAPQVVLGGSLLVIAIGLAAMAVITVNSSWTVLIPGLVITGIGIGIANPAIARIGLGVVPPQRSGMASGISNTCRIGGLATGVAALGAIFQQHLTSSLTPSFGASATSLAQTLSAGGVRAVSSFGADHVKVIAASHLAFVSGMRLLLIGAAIVVGAGGIIGAVFIRRHDFFHAPTGQPASPEAEAAAAAAH